MNADALFQLSSALVLPGWLLLIVAPGWRASARIIAGVVVPALLGGLYVALIVTAMPGAPGGFGSLAEVAALFEDRRLLLAGWIHYLAFDLFVGSWEVRDAQRHRIPHLLVVPCLVLTFMLGPAGLLLYLALRGAMRRRLAHGDDA